MLVVSLSANVEFRASYGHSLGCWFVVSTSRGIACPACNGTRALLFRVDEFFGGQLAGHTTQWARLYELTWHIGTSLSLASVIITRLNASSRTFVFFAICP